MPPALNRSIVHKVIKSGGIAFGAPSVLAVYEYNCSVGGGKKAWWLIWHPSDYSNMLFSPFVKNARQIWPVA